MSDDFGLNSGYTGEIRHADKLLEATQQWCHSISSWAALCDVAALEKEVQGWWQLQSYKCLQYAMNPASVRRGILADENSFMTFWPAMCFHSLLHASSRHQ